MAPARNRIWKVLAVFLALLAAWCLLTALSHFWGIGIPCVFFAVTGLYCPGCGTTRAIASLLHLELYQAFRYNSLFLIIAPFLAISMARSICHYIRFGTQAIPSRAEKACFTVILAAAVVFGVARNLPVFHMLAPVSLS